MGNSFSDPALILSGAVGTAELADGAVTEDKHDAASKKDTVSGVAALDSSGNLLSKGALVYLPRDGTNNIIVMERTAGEQALKITRTGAADFDAYINETAGYSQLQTASMKNIASGIVGLDAQKLIGGGIHSAFNLLKIYDASANSTFTEALTGTGVITASIANGTVQVSCPVNADTARFYLTTKIALSALPRIIIFKVNSITMAGGGTNYMEFGLAATSGAAADRVVLESENGGTSWNFVTYAAAATSTAIDAPVAGDVFIIYAANDRCVLFKNGAFIAAHTTELPTDAISPMANVYNAAASGAGNQITLGFMG